jgi:hypothetical protein
MVVVLGWAREHFILLELDVTSFNWSQLGSWGTVPQLGKATRVALLADM